MRAGRLSTTAALISAAVVLAGSCGSQGRTLRTGTHGQLTPSGQLTPPPRVGSVPPDHVTAVRAAQFGQISVLKHSGRRADDLSPSVAADIAKYPRELTSGRPISVGSARRVVASDHPAWVLTNEYDTVCLLQQVPIPGRKQTGHNLICAPMARVLGGWLIATLSYAPGQQGPTLVQGVVPDGVPLVRIRTPGDKWRTVAVAANAYSFTTSHPEVVGFDRNGRRYNALIPGPPTRKGP